MNKKTMLTLVIFNIALHLSAYAESTLTLTINNESNYSFIYDRVEIHNIGNKIKLSDNNLAPHSQIIVTGTITEDNDLSGVIYFKDGSRFRIKDPRRFHFGQPIFEMNSPSVGSEVTSRTENPDKNPRHLHWSAATVTLRAK